MLLIVAGTSTLIETEAFRPKKPLEAMIWGSRSLARVVAVVMYTLQSVTTIMYTLRLKGKTLSQ